MPKFKKEVIKGVGSGPIKTEIEAWDGMLACFSKRECNAIIRDALWQGGEFWRTVFLPMRFTDYAKKLGYKVTKRWESIKNKNNASAPLVWRGVLQRVATNQARTEARATSSNQYVQVRIPTPSYANQQPTVYKTLHTLPSWEVDRVAEVIGKAFVAIFEGAKSDIGSRSGKMSLPEGVKNTMRRSMNTPKARTSTTTNSGRA